MIKVTMFIAVGKKTFSETHVCIATSNIGDTYPFAAALATARAKLLGYGALIQRVRISDTTPGKQRQVAYLDTAAYTSVSALTKTASGDTDEANSALQLRFTTPAQPKTMYLAGVPNDILGPFFDEVDFIQAEIDPVWLQSYLAYAGGLLGTPISQLTNGNWGCAQKSTLAPQVATAVVPGAPWVGNAAVATAAPLAAIAGSRILVKGFRSINPRAKGISGVYIVAAVLAGNVYVLSGTTAAQVANVKTLPGTAADLTFAPQRYTGCVPIKAATRKRGGRVFLPLGRSLIRH